MYRQGDLLFIKTNERPKGKPLKEKTILCSSVTGHSHKITLGTVYDNRDNTGWQLDRFYVVVPDGCKLIHEEHATIELPAGTYQVRQQREVNGYVED